jgi:hypothetical protein
MEWYSNYRPSTLRKWSTANYKGDNNQGNDNDQGNTDPVAPLPAALPLFATGIGGLGLLGWRRKRKAQAVA